MAATYRLKLAGRNRESLLVVKRCTAALAITATAVVGLVPGQGNGAVSAAAQASGSVAVGVVCEDGLLLPIAALRGATWRSLTDDERAEAGVPLKLTAEARNLPRAGWTIVPFDAAVASRPLTLEGSALLDDTSVCTDQEGFHTDAPSARSRRPTDFIGIAVTGGVRVEPVETVQHLPDPASRRVGRLIAGLVEALEAERAEAVAASAGERHARRVPSAEQRSRVDVEILNMWRHRHADNDWYYFEAQKDYTEENDTGNTLVKGWLVAASSGDGASLMNVRVSIGNAFDGVTVQGNALGVLRVEDHVVWILYEQTYESRSFELVAIGRERRQPVCILHGC